VYHIQYQTFTADKTRKKTRMCGIAGAIWFREELNVARKTLEAMTQALQHRGPDDKGYLLQPLRQRPPYAPDPGIALGHRRLSIIDLEGGRQPMQNEDGSVHVIFNGEIYNYPALRNRLEGAGHTFSTQSDTEAIVHLYEDEGPECFAHLNGMFAIAIWDARQQRVVLGRDRLGQKPLVYREEAGRLWFASQLKSLLEAPGAPRELDVDSVDEYLTYQYVPHPGTILRSYRKLPPGHAAVFDAEGLHVQPYWQPDFNHQRQISAEHAAAELQQLLTSSVSMRMRSDVPLGAFLSGGVDSSLVAALMQQQSAKPVKTFSIGFAQKEFDETEHARSVASHLNTQHHEFKVTPDAIAMLPELIWHYDEPFADSSAIPTWCVAQQTRTQVTVALTGDGGDELFAGYRRYQAAAMAGRLDRLGLLKAVLGSRLWQLLPAPSAQSSKLRQFKRFSEAINQTPQRRYLDWISIFNEQRRGAIYENSFLTQLSGADPASFLEQAWSRASSRDVVTQASLADLTTYLPCDLNTKVDVASMAHSLECRQPFLDHRLVEFAAALPATLKHRRGRGKLLLRAAFGTMLPDAIWQRRKMGFGVPMASWLRNELRPLLHDTLLSQPAIGRGIFQQQAVQNLLDQHDSRKFDHSYRLWALLVLELWQQRWL